MVSRINDIALYPHLNICHSTLSAGVLIGILQWPFSQLAGQRSPKMASLALMADWSTVVTLSH
jgi:hypothetical protein